MADGPVLRSKPLGGVDRPPESELELLSIAVISYTYVYYLRSLHPMIRLICDAHNE